MNLLLENAFCCTWLFEEFDGHVEHFVGGRWWLWCELYHCVRRSYLLSYFFEQIITRNGKTLSVNFRRIVELFVIRIRNASVNKFVNQWKICGNCSMTNRIRLLLKATQNCHRLHQQLNYQFNQLFFIKTLHLTVHRKRTSKSWISLPLFHFFLQNNHLELSVHYQLTCDVTKRKNKIEPNHRRMSVIRFSMWFVRCAYSMHRRMSRKDP